MKPLTNSAQGIWDRAFKKIESWKLAPIEVNESTGYITITGCWGRSGIQIYFDEKGNPFGRYRSPEFIKQLGDALVDAPISLQHSNIHVSDYAPPKHGWVTQTWTRQDSGETLGFCKVVLDTQDAVDEIITQLNTQGYCYLPLSPAYDAPVRKVSGCWVDTGGFYSNNISEFAYTEEHVTPIHHVNHLSIVDFGRGGPLACLYATVGPTLDGLKNAYPYPTIAPKRRRETNMENDKQQMTAQDMIRDMKESMDAMKQGFQDMMDKDGYKGAQDMVKDMKESMDAFKKGMDDYKDAMSTQANDMKAAHDELSVNISSLVSAIKESYNGSEMPTGQTQKVDQSTQKKGESAGFIFDGQEATPETNAPAPEASEMSALASALDSLAKMAEASQASQKEVSDRLGKMEERAKSANGTRTGDQLSWDALGSNQGNSNFSASIDEDGNELFEI